MRIQQNNSLNQAETNEAQQKEQKVNAGELQDQSGIAGTESTVERGFIGGFFMGPIIGTTIGGAIGDAAAEGNEAQTQNFENILKTLGDDGKLQNFEIQNLTTHFHARQELQGNFEAALQELQNKEKLGNFEIQNLMSDFNQAETLFNSSASKSGEMQKLDVSDTQRLTDLFDQKVDLNRRFADAMKNFEAQDRMGNFEIQRLMSAFNQAETLSSNMQKKSDDTISGQQQKIG
jgi:hypothetical protein